MKYAIVLGALLLTGCHLGEAVSEINRVDPATGKTVGQELAEKAVRQVADPYNFTGWLDLGVAVATLAGVAIYGKKSSTKHSATQEKVEALVEAVKAVPKASA